MSDLLTYFNDATDQSKCTALKDGGSATSCAVNSATNAVIHDPGFLFGHRYGWVAVAALTAGAGYYFGKKAR